MALGHGIKLDCSSRLGMAVANRMRLIGQMIHQSPVNPQGSCSAECDMTPPDDEKVRKYSVFNNVLMTPDCKGAELRLGSCVVGTRMM